MRTLINKYSIAFILFICTNNGEAMTDETVGRIDEAVLKATLKIKTSGNTLGTGFIISKPAANGRRYFFLVTNKHLIGNYNLVKGELEDFYDFIQASVYKKDSSIQEIKIPLKDKKGKLNELKVFPYPAPYIDVAVISVADDLAKVNETDIFSFDLSYLATNEILKNWHVDIGDQVFALGYPLNIYSKSNNYPIAKSGYISSKIGEELVITMHYKDRNNNIVPCELRGKIILLDGTLVNGNSGGPIILPRGRRERTNIKTDEVQFTNQSIPNFIIGVQSQSVISANVSLTFSSEYILELINKISHLCP